MAIEEPMFCSVLAAAINARGCVVKKDMDFSLTKNKPAGDGSATVVCCVVRQNPEKEPRTLGTRKKGEIIY
jgi:hypothetical protein